MHEFLILDSTRKPTIRKGADYQAFIPLAIPSNQGTGSQPGQPKEQLVSEGLAMLGRQLPEMGPFNRISLEKLRGTKPLVPVNGVKQTKTQLEGELEGYARGLYEAEAWRVRAQGILTEISTGRVVAIERLQSLLEAGSSCSLLVRGEEVVRLEQLVRQANAFGNKIKKLFSTPVGTSAEAGDKITIEQLSEILSELSDQRLETKETRLLIQQREQYLTILRAWKESDKSLEKMKDLAQEAESLRVKLPFFKHMVDSVQVSEWLQKVQSKLERRGPVPLTLVEQLLAEAAAELVSPGFSEVKQQLIAAQSEGEVWLKEAKRVVTGKCKVEEIAKIWEAHAKLTRVSCTNVALQLENILKKARVWVKRVERLQELSQVDLTEAKAMLTEGEQLSGSVDVTEEVQLVRGVVEEGEKWANEVSEVLRLVDKREAEVLPIPDEEEVTTTRPNKRAKIDVNAPAVGGSTASVVVSVVGGVVGIVLEIESILTKLPPRSLSEIEFESVTELLGRKPKAGSGEHVEGLETLRIRGERFKSRVRSVLSAPFPRAAGVLRQMAMLLSEISSVAGLKFPEREELVTAAKMEIWWHKIASVAKFPLTAETAESLIGSGCPLEIPEAEKFGKTGADLVVEWAALVKGSDAKDRLRRMLEILGNFRSHRKWYEEELYGRMLTEQRSRADWENFASMARNDEIFDLSEISTKAEDILKVHRSLSEQSEAFGNFLFRKEATEGGVSEPMVHPRLAVLSKACRKSPIAVEHYETKIVPVMDFVQSLQEKVKEVMQGAPSLGQVRDLAREVQELARSKNIPEEFLMSVGQVGNFLKGLKEAEDWLVELIEETKISSREKKSLAIYKKLMTRGAQLIVRVELPADTLTAEDMEMIDIFSARVSRKNRYSVEEARELLTVANNSRIVRASIEFAALHEELEATVTLDAAAQHMLTTSRDERSRVEKLSVLRGANETLESQLYGEMFALLKEARRLSIKMPTEEALEIELEVRNKNAILAKAVAMFGSTTLEQAEQFMQQLDRSRGEISNLLMSAFTQKLEQTRVWKSSFSVPVHDGNYDGRFPDLVNDTVLAAWYAFYETQTFTPTPQPRDYANPLPLVDYALKKRGRLTKENKAQAASMPTILGRVPWLNLLHIEAGTDALLALAQKTKEERLRERDALIERWTKPGLTLETALCMLAHHKALALLPLPELGKLRTLVEVSLNFQAKTVQRFPFLHHMLAPGEAEIWEEQVFGNGDVAEAKAAATGAVTASADVETLFTALLEADKLLVQTPVKRRIVDAMIVYYDWKIRAQCLCHKLPDNFRPRPWHEAEFVRSVELFAVTAQRNFDDVFEADIQHIPALDAAVQRQAVNHAITCRPLRSFLQGVNNVRFFYVVEAVRHFHRVFSEMCELCSSITTVESDNLFWISCDKCESWFHGPCAALIEPSDHFVCPQCIIKDPYASPVQKQAATVIISACASVGPKSMGQPVATFQKTLEEGERMLIAKVIDTPELGILRRTIARRS